jgi:hypothetical protein
VTWVWEAATAAEAAHVTVALTAETSAQHATAARDSATILVKDVVDRATLAKRKALERVSRVEVENAVALASARKDAEGLVRKITRLEGEVAEVHPAREMAEENSCGLSSAVVDAE